MEISSFLKIVRKSKKLTQKQLAQKMGCSDRQIIRWENKDSSISFENLEQFAKALEMEINPQIFIPKNND